MPKVSVLMPNYNASAFIKEAIESLLNQSFQDFQIIVVDDCSTDNSVDVIKSINSSKIKLYSTSKNGGIVAALNEGLKHITTKYFVRMDSDDISREDRLEKLVSFMDDNPNIGVCGSYIETFGNYNSLWEYYENDKDIRPYILYASMMPHAASIFRTKLFAENNIKYTDKFMHIEDGMLWLELFDKTKFANLPFPLYKYRILNHNITTKNRDTFHKRSSDFFYHVACSFNIPLSYNQIYTMRGFGNQVPISKKSIQNYTSWIKLVTLFNKKHSIFNKASFKKHMRTHKEKIFNRVLMKGSNRDLVFFFKNTDSLPLIWIFKTILHKIKKGVKRIFKNGK